MEYFILFLIIIFYLNLNSNIKKILNNGHKDNKKDFSMLKSLIGKEIEIDTDDEYSLVFGTSTKGILKEFNDTWLVIETKKKDKLETLYYRINNIQSISDVK